MEPIITPDTKYFCIKGYSTIMGIIDIIMTQYFISTYITFTSLGSPVSLLALFWSTISRRIICKG